MPQADGTLRISRSGAPSTLRLMFAPDENHVAKSHQHQYAVFLPDDDDEAAHLNYVRQMTSGEVELRCNTNPQIVDVALRAAEKLIKVTVHVTTNSAYEALMVRSISFPARPARTPA